MSHHCLLDRLIEGTLTWLAARLDSFRPSPDPSASDPSRGPVLGRLDAGRKAMGELALLVFIAQRYPPLAERGEVRGMLQHLEHLAQEEAASTRPHGGGFGSPERLPLHLLMSAVLEAGSRPVTRSPNLDFRILSPPRGSGWLNMELAYLLAATGMPGPEPDWRSLYRQCHSDLPTRVARLGPLDVYVLTHVLFYLSDYACRDPGPYLGGDAGAVRHRVVESLGVALVRRDPDQVAELVLACRCLGVQAEPFVEIAWRELAEWQQASGEIQHADFPENYRSEHSEVDLPDIEGCQAEKDFRWNYHPTLVTGLAAIVERYASAANSASPPQTG